MALIYAALQVVVGGGPIGQLCCRIARHYGAAAVCLSEPSAERRRYAEASQADRAFDPTTEAADIERLKAYVVLECSGSEPGIRSSLAAARPEGTVIVVGGGRSGGFWRSSMSSLTAAQYMLTGSWWVTVNRMARAILTLADAGLGWEAIPPGRSMIEFCLWAVALSTDDGKLVATVMRNADDACARADL